ncbi:hypothetical protein [Pleomorphomonas sp. JP5]|uniref:hypothetical protein n=1 Tax=Pleomorphomonas sp. JP5 TaxID=2942998 RepID=UPI002043D3A0|nr:hypothetical protein [Pleomorphomonas sp. JP5]MCM5560327.1 hypothetical protein [Pleomorphomonas sp. JP5]
MTGLLGGAIAFVKADWRLVLLVALAAGLGLAAWRIYAAGAASEVARQNAGSLEALQERVVIDEKLDRETIEDLCRRAGGGAGCGGLREHGRPTR